MTKINYREIPRCIGIVGSRSFLKHETEKHKVFTHINTFVQRCPEHTTIVSGGAIGVDSWAARSAKQSGKRLIEYRPKKDIPIPARFFARNQEIVDHLKDYKGALYAFIDVDSWRGTSHGVEYALKKGVPVTIFKFDRAGNYLGWVDNVEEYVYNYRNG